jgi:hypothetical protein
LAFCTELLYIDLGTLRGGAVAALCVKRTAGLAFRAGIVRTLSGLPDGVASVVSDKASAGSLRKLPSGSRVTRFHQARPMVQQKRETPIGRGGSPSRPIVLDRSCQITAFPARSASGSEQAGRHPGTWEGKTSLAPSPAKIAISRFLNQGTVDACKPAGSSPAFHGPLAARPPCPAARPHKHRFPTPQPDSGLFPQASR